MVTAGTPSIDRTARLEGFTIRGGNSSSPGAGISVMGASPTISNCVITENTGDYAAGVIIAIPGADVLISHSRIIANTASSNAGGIQVTSEANLELVQSEVLGNTAGSWAGGILGTGNATISIQDSLIQQNSASYGSGLMMNGAAGFSLLDSRVITNTAGSAAAVYVSETGYEIRGSTIAGNVAAGNVGIVIRADSDGSIIDNLIQHNRATANIGGAITVENATAAISGNQIISNTVEDQSGAGVYVTGASAVEIRGNTIARNRATGGAGIAVGTGAEAVIEDNVIEDNRAMLHAGGGISIWAGGTAQIGQNWIAGNTGGGVDIAGTASLENNMIVRSSQNTEHPDGQGQVRIVSGEAVTLTNNTIAGNGAGYGVEIRATGSLSLTNNLVVDHSYGLYSDGATTPWLAHNDVWDNAIADYYGLDRGATDISADPDFVDLAGDDYHLGTCSAAVDAGTNVDAPPVDYDGDVRPVDGHGTGSAVTDIGADERQTVTAPLPQAAFSYVTDGWDVISTNESLDAVSYAWDFGDGVGTSTEVDPTYTYSRSGPFTVTLTASCSFGCEDVHQEAVELDLLTIYLPLVLRAEP
jgi:parallel beta-helix repeat protein